MNSFLSLKSIYKHNKKYILANWKKEFVRERYGFSSLRYIKDILNAWDRPTINQDIDRGELERELYASL